MSSNAKKIVKISKALADENRHKIFQMISQKGEISCTEIAAAFPLSQPTISHHLRVLMESGLVEFRKEGQWSYFYISQEVLEFYLSSFIEHISQ